MKHRINYGWTDEFRGKMLKCEFCRVVIKYDTNYCKIANDVNQEFAVLGNVFAEATEFIVLCPKCYTKLQKQIIKLKQQK